MNTKKIKNEFEACIDDIQDILSEISELCEVELADEELSEKVISLNEHMQNAIDEHVPDMVDLIDSLMVD